VEARIVDMNGSKLILLVEDNESDEMAVLRGLKQSNVDCKVEVSRDGVDAVEYLSDVSRRIPSLVLLDLKLPKMNGLEVLRRIRAEARTRNVPVVVFTSSTHEADVIGCFGSGANSFVLKALDYGIYLDRVSKLAEYWLLINEECSPS